MNAALLRLASLIGVLCIAHNCAAMQPQVLPVTPFIRIAHSLNLLDLAIVHGDIHPIAFKQHLTRLFQQIAYIHFPPERTLLLNKINYTYHLFTTHFRPHRDGQLRYHQKQLINANLNQYE